MFDVLLEVAAYAVWGWWADDDRPWWQILLILLLGGAAIFGIYWLLSH